MNLIFNLLRHYSHQVKAGMSFFPLSSVVQCGRNGCTEMKNLKACSRCKNRWYCSVEHQKEDWKSHKKVCVPVISTAAPTTAASNTTEASGGLSWLNNPSDNPSSYAKSHYTLQEMPRVESIYSLNSGKFTLLSGYKMLNSIVSSVFAHFKDSHTPMPPQSEGVMGIHADPPFDIVNGRMVITIGGLVRRLWYALWRTKKHEDKVKLQQEVVMMMLLGNYPEWLQLEALELAADESNGDRRVAQELLERGLDNIKYDILLFRLKWGPLSETDIQSLCEK